jgi:hypothetical protein
MVNPCCDVTKTTVNEIKKLSKMADITSSENISRSKQDMKNREKKLIYSFKSSFKWENKNLYCHFPLIKKHVLAEDEIFHVEASPIADRKK